MFGVPNSESEFNDCLYKHCPYVDGIITDRPLLLKECIQKADQALIKEGTATR